MMAKPIELRDDEGLAPNAADPDAVEAARLQDEQGRTEALNDVRAVMSTREGRRAVRRWLGLHGLYRSLTAVESSALTYALSGRRDAGLEMLEDLVTADRKLFLVMEEENHEDEVQRQRIAAAQRTRLREHVAA